MNRFGKPDVVMPRYASGPSFHASSIRRPSRPTTSIADRYFVVAKPVAMTMVSTSRSVPSAVTTPRSVTRAIGSVTSSRFGSLNAG